MRSKTHACAHLHRISGCMKFSPVEKYRLLLDDMQLSNSASPSSLLSQYPGLCKRWFIVTYVYIYIVFWFNKIAEIFAELGIQTKILAQCNDCISTIILEYSYKMHVNLEYQMQFLACSILLTCLPVRIDIALSSAKFRSNAFFTRRLIAKLCVIPHFYTYYIFLGFVSVQSADSGSPK